MSNLVLNKESMPRVAMDFMNDVHEQDIDIVNDLYASALEYEKNPSAESKTALMSKYSAWFEHTIEHFQGEEVLMIEKKFPPYPMHKSEHDNALARMDDVYRNFEKDGDIAALKQYLSQTVPQWFVQHVQSMDTVTAMFFSSGMSPCSMR